MFPLLKIEWLKLKNYRTFWVLSTLFVLGIFGINYIVYQVQSDVGRQDEMAKAIIGGPFRFPDVWHSVSFTSSFLLFIPGLLMIIFITNEFSFKTHRQHIIDGLSRTQFIHVKMMLGVLMALFSTLVVFLTAYLFGLAEAEPFSTEKIEYVGYFFVQVLSYVFIALLFGLLFRRSGIAIGVFFLYTLIFDELMAGLLKRYAGSIGYYTPLESNDVLIPFPFGQNMTERFLDHPEPGYLLLAAVLYLLAYYFFSRRKFETADL